MHKTSKYLIYALIDPRLIGKDVRYIGQSATGLQRIKEHKKKSSLRYETYKNHWIRQLLQLNIDYTYRIIEELDSPDKLNEREIYWIKYYKENGYDLTNGTLGGEGSLGRKLTEKSKVLMSIKRKEYNKLHYNEVIKKGKESRIPYEVKNGVCYKHCCKCKKFQIISDFSFNKAKWDGLHSLCKPCDIERKAVYRARKEYILC